MTQLLSGMPSDEPAVVLHSWGDYKVELAGIHPKFQHYLGGGELAAIERSFFERFRPDWLHLGSGSEKDFHGRERQVTDGRCFIRSADGSKWLEVKDDYYLEQDGCTPAEPTQPLRLDSKSEIDDYYAARRRSAEDVVRSGRYDHIAMLSYEYGGTALIAVNDGAPGCGIPNHSFEDALIACFEKPDLVAHCIFRDCERFLADVRAAKACGAHAFIFSEGFGGSLDMLSPDMHERLELDTKKWFYSEVRKIGLLPIGYWLGDVRPNMALINALDMAGLMIEESKKSFVLDAVEIRKQLRPDVCLFGNVDSLLVKRGPVSAIRDEVRRQKQAESLGPFVTANGSPLIIGTPEEHIDAFLEEARS